MSEKIKIAIIFGGKSAEHEVSLVSAGNIIQALDKQRYEIFQIGISPEGTWFHHPDILTKLKNREFQDCQEVLIGGNQQKPGFYVLDTNKKSSTFHAVDVVFPVLHGTYGEDGTIQGLFEMMGVPYVGAGVLASSMGMDKIVQKEIFKFHGLPVVSFKGYTNTSDLSIKEVCAEIKEEFSLPLFIKPANLGSSIGISKVTAFDSLEDAIKVAFQFDRKLIVEQGIPNAREIEISVLGNENPRASLPGEVIPSREFYDYRAKYEDTSSKLIIPAPLPERLTEEMRNAALDAYKAIDCNGMGRIDFLLAEGQQFYISEINTIPGFTKISMYPKLWEATGIPYSALLDELIGLAFEKHEQKKRLTTRSVNISEWYK